MIAVLLCAGYATRLYPLTRNYPKPLLPVAGKPVIDYLVEQLGALPHLEALHVVTNARFYAHFTSWAHDRTASESSTLSITVHNDGTKSNADRLGAVGDLYFVLQQIDVNTPLIAAAADNIFCFSIASIWKRFLRTRHHLVLALPQNDLRQLRKTGVLELDDHDRVLRLHEKPENPPSIWSCPPLYFFQPTVQRHLRDLMAGGHPPDAPGHLIDYLCRRDTVEALKIDGTRLDIGDIRSYHQADRLLRTSPPSF